MRSARLALPLLGWGALHVACGADEPPAPCAGVELIVASSEGGSSMICAAPGACVGGIELGVDPVLATTNGRAFLVSRGADLLVEVDPSCGTPRSRVSLDSLAPRDSLGKIGTANPHDVAAARDGTLVVPLYDVPKLAFVKNGALDGEPLDLSPYDPDGNPQADAVRIVEIGGAAKAFVTLERLEDYLEPKSDYMRSKRPSQMLRVDVTTRTVEAVIELEGRNPFNTMPEVDGVLFMAEPGNFNAADDELAGIERFDTATSETHIVVRERDLGGSVAEIAVTKGCGAAIIAGPQKGANPTAVVTFDPDSGRIIASLQAPILGPTPGYDLYGLAWRGNNLYVGDRRRSGTSYAVNVFERTGDCTLTNTGRTLDLPQAPIALRAAREKR